MEKDYYAILGVPKNATTKDIQQAFQRQALRLYRERLQNNNTQQAFANAGEAFEVLSDPARRSIYDQFGERKLKDGSWLTYLPPEFVNDQPDHSTSPNRFEPPFQPSPPTTVYQNFFTCSKRTSTAPLPSLPLPSSSPTGQPVKILTPSTSTPIRIQPTQADRQPVRLAVNFASTSPDSPLLGPTANLAPVLNSPPISSLQQDPDQTLFDPQSTLDSIDPVHSSPSLPLRPPLLHRDSGSMVSSPPLASATVRPMDSVVTLTNLSSSTPGLTTIHSMNDTSAITVTNSLTSGSQSNPSSSSSSRIYHKKTITVTLDELYHHSPKQITVERQLRDGTTASKRLLVHVRPEWRSGTKVKFPGAGHELPGGGSQDLICLVQVLPHPVFKRHGDDLEATLEISLLEALIGFQRTIPLLDHTALDIESNAIIQPGHQVCIKGRGMPISKTSNHGDIIIRYNVLLPQHLSSAQKKTITKALQD
ncbi:DnaJ-domain-containing protein [Hesseltinella vesiculosa]|uniref:DnaJ-domain-containing protein n=1 Tax=Hesseltinella vesiculosa TaxID=101127 RepID=A0A1X2GXA4_9FUNG|nr:DnaJ-domain-containing protein [Hesseltinella vesiculosa]